MVLGIRLIFLALIANACVQRTNAEATHEEGVNIGGLELTLVTRDAQCLVENGDALVALEIPAPCRFLRRGVGAIPVVHEYGETAVTLVAGALANPQDYDVIDYLSPTDECSHIGRGVIVRERKLTLTDILVSPLGYCREIAPDEKFYYGLAHP